MQCIDHGAFTASPASSSSSPAEPVAPPLPPRRGVQGRAAIVGLLQLGVAPPLAAAPLCGASASQTYRSLWSREPPKDCSATHSTRRAPPSQRQGLPQPTLPPPQHGPAAALLGTLRLRLLHVGVGHSRTLRATPPSCGRRKLHKQEDQRRRVAPGEPKAPRGCLHNCGRKP